MKNKKGFSIFRVILYFLFLAVIVLIFTLTFKAIKEGNSTKSKNSNIFESRVLMESPTMYNPIDYISNGYILGYNTSDFNTANSFKYAPLNYESNSSIKFYYNGSYQNVSSEHIPTNSLADSITDSFIDLGYALNTAHSIIYRTYSQMGSFVSFSIAYDCYIPCDNFSFVMNYNFGASSTSFNINFYILTDSGSSTFPLSFSSSSRSYTFNSSSILSSLPSSSFVTRFGFGVAATSSSSNNATYLPQSDGSSSMSGINYARNNVYETYYNSILDSSTKSNLCRITFVDSPLSSSYVEGYNNGYTEGLNYNNGVINNLQSQISSLQGVINNLESTINNQSLIISNLQAQLNNSQNNYKDLFFTFADIPLRTIHNFLNFDFFGLNLFRFFTGILTALGCFWLIKKFL